MEQDDNSLATSSIKDNEIRVTSGGNINRLVQIGLDKLKVHPFIVIVAKGKVIQKAISVVEIVKRQMGGALHQYNQLGTVSSKEEWTLAMDNELGSGTLDDSSPIIIVRLSHNAIPDLEGLTTYQAPPAQPE
ncbi:hypothetical protein [Absidia glauca]|uniref:DNA/RNA-binding protein Alba-like domain-containing protein n=1 Tax=Absidia glauca TaxID=4829 RepID=A0A163JHT0_ABSGL|nr:hypothetical protein [Absidia glauca]